MTSDRYPPARRFDVVDRLHGVEVPDPYRWLEDPAHDGCREWSAAQDDLCRTVLDAFEERPSLRDELVRRMPGMVSAPVARGDRLFFLRRLAAQDHAVFFVREPDGREVALVDPNALSAEGLVTLDAASVSPSGRLLAYQLSEGGDEESVLRFLDTTTLEVVDGPIDRCRYSPVAWEPDESAVYLVRKLTADQAPDGNDQLHRRVHRHVLGTDADTADELVWGDGSPSGTYFDVDLSRDGRWLVVSASVGTAPRHDLWLADRHGDGRLRLVHGADRDAQTDATIGFDGRLWLHTNLDAPRWRLAVCDPTTPDPANWVDVLPEDPGGSVLQSVHLTTGAIVAIRVRDVMAEVAVHETDGALRRSVDLPGLGTAVGSVRRDGGDDVWIWYGDHLTPGVVLHHDVVSGGTSTWAVTPGAMGLDGVTATQLFVESTDGARVPMTVLARAGLVRDRTAPTILYGYGGFDVSLSPEYSASIAAWVASGGVYVIANLRGGGEYGEAWHRAGMRNHKQHVFDDFHACAERLVADGYTSPLHLGISGGSNGGLLVGVALTQRPDLYRSVVCSAPLLDMVRYERFGLGSTWNDEYGRADDPDEFGWLWAYSPYHHVHPGTEYPATLFTVFDSDTRVDPLHARKLCAALQWASAGSVDERPILLRRERDVGHGARSVGRTIDLAADQLAFHARQLGLHPR